MRNILTTIQQLLNVIPKTEKQLRKNLLEISDKNWYVAPELQNWKPISLLLSQTLPYPPEVSWQEKVLKIITDKEDCHE